MTSIITSSSSTSSALSLLSKPSANKVTDAHLEKQKKLQENFNTPAATQIVLQTKNEVEGRVVTPQTQVATQSLGSTDNSSSLEISTPSAKEQFLDFVNGSWEERFTEMVLKSMGLTQDDLNNMSAEERSKIEAKIREKIKEEIEKKTGIEPSQTADLATAIASAAA